MEKIRRKGKAEGSVLFTVVSVMMVMVVFLMSTLVLTTSANRRSYYTYYENQAQYTAQGVLDAISNSAYNNPTFYKWVTELGENGVPDVGVVDVGLTFSDPDNRIPLTKDGQAIRATVETIKDDSGNNKYNYIWDAETGAIRKQKGWKITVTASVGQGRNASEYTMANYIYENYRNPVISANQNRATWVITNTLQVTDSTLHTGNPSSDSPNKANAMYTGGGASFMSGNNLLCLGPQTFGITHTPLGNGRGGITANSSYNADTHSNVFANQSVTVGNGIFVGNFSTNDKIYFEFQQKGEGAQFWGNFTVTNFASFLSNINSFNESGTTAKTAYRDIPYIYCDGNLQFAENTQAKIGGDSGKKTQPVNIYANQMTHRPNDMMGDIFLFDPTKTSDLSSTQKTKLSRFVGDNIQKTNTTTPGYVAGDIISNNAELKISGCAKIGGDIIFTNPNGTLTIENVKDDGFEIGGAILCAGNLVIKAATDKPFTVAGGIYAKTATITGKVNGVENPSAETVCKNLNAAPEPYHDSSYTTIGNSERSAHFESLGMRGYDCKENEGYADLVNNLLTGALGGTTYSSDYNGADYSMFPFCSRQDEIFTQYLRWDLANENQTTAESNMNGDPYVKESSACGHAWAVYQKFSDDHPNGIWVPGTTPVGVTVVDSNKAKTQSANCFIPPLDTQKKQPTGVGYESDATTFVSTHNITATETYDAPAHTVKFISHAADGTKKEITLDNVPVINDSCVLNISNQNKNHNKDHTIFIDPTAKHSSANPLCILLTGAYDNGVLDLVINNTGTYSGSYSNYTSYAKAAHATKTTGGTVTFAGRTDVLIFLASDCAVNKTLRIITTGSYQQVMDHVYDVISNPIYPGVKQDDGSYVLGAEWDAMYSEKEGDDEGNKDAFKYEMIPNVVVYGQAGTNYDNARGGQACFPNGMLCNAEVIMPESTFSAQSGEDSIKAKTITYREFTDSVSYDYGADSVNNGKLVISLGTLYCQDLNVKNIPICIYLGDLGRPGTPPSKKINITGVGAESSSSGSIQIGNNNDLLANDHQGAS